MRGILRRRLDRLRNTYLGAPMRADAFLYEGPPPRPRAEMGPIERRFWDNRGAAIDKWHHYLPIYDRHFAPYRESAPRFLEIGVQNGGSMAMWRDFFGAQATIYGIDIDPACAALDGRAGAVRIGSQADGAFLRDVVREMGGIDIVLDDGSHRMAHMRRSFDVLFPLLSEGGIYVVEDLHTAYWRAFGGAKARRGTFLNFARRLVDDMHHWYSQLPPEEPALSGTVTGVHFYDSVVVIDKGAPGPPRRTMIGEAREVFGAGVAGFQTRTEGSDGGE